MGTSTYSHENDGDRIFISMSASFSVTADAEGPDDDGTAVVKQPTGPEGAPPTAAAEPVPDLR